ncbi:hypothetical protein GGF32_001164 [Allomyces javanicus]|nr:hypothetical protein GGF32_001164 [Allomyces javanicus]
MSALVKIVSSVAMMMMGIALSSALAQSKFIDHLARDVVAWTGIDRPAIPFAVLLVTILLGHWVSSNLAYLIQAFTHSDLELNDPRAARARLAPNSLASRAFAAHQNAMEIIPSITAAVIVAHARKVDLHHRVALSLVFVLARVAHWVAYVTDVPPLRTLTFAMGIGCIVALFGLAIHPDFAAVYWGMGLAFGGNFAGVQDRIRGWLQAGAKTQGRYEF